MTTAVVQLSPTSHPEPQLTALISSIAELHMTCIRHDHTMATFLPPLDRHRIGLWWRSLVDEVGRGTRDILVILLNHPTDEVIGVVSLAKPASETGAMRGLVEKLFVHPHHRGRGLSRVLMRELESLARSHRRWLLLLDTEKGSPAQSIYVRLGFEVMGECRDYGWSPRDGKLVDEVFFR